MLSPDGNTRATYSVLWTLRRITVEIAQVSVPVTSDIVVTDDQGVKRLNVEAMKQAAIELGADPSVQWRMESQIVDHNPMQLPPIAGGEQPSKADGDE